MSRWLLALLLALSVMVPVTDALQSIAAAVQHGGTARWLELGGDVVRAGLTLAIALAVLAAVDDPPKRPLWLLDWRLVVRRGRVVGHGRA